EAVHVDPGALHGEHPRERLEDDVDETHGPGRPAGAAVDDDDPQRGSGIDDRRGGGHAAPRPRAAISRRTTGATSVPSRSMPSRWSGCGSPRNPVWNRARVRPYSSW